jgi:hypothetical protein
MFRASRVSKRTGFERKARAWTTKRPNTEKQANTAAATQQRRFPPLIELSPALVLPPAPGPVAYKLY